MKNIRKLNLIYIILWVILALINIAVHNWPAAFGYVVICYYIFILDYYQRNYVKRD